MRLLRVRAPPALGYRHFPRQLRRIAEVSVRPLRIAQHDVKGSHGRAFAEVRPLKRNRGGVAAVPALLRQALEHRVVQRHLAPDVRKQPLVRHQRRERPPQLAQTLPRAVAHALAKEEPGPLHALPPQPAQAVCARRGFLRVLRGRQLRLELLHRLVLRVERFSGADQRVCRVVLLA